MAEALARHFGSLEALAGATLCLGVGFYSYITAVFLMPAFLVLTALVLWRRGAIEHWRFGVIGFAVPFAIFVLWVGLHASVFADTFARYGLGSSHRIGPVERFGLYWRYLSPSFLFFNGGSQLVFSSRVAGVFPVFAVSENTLVLQLASALTVAVVAALVPALKGARVRIVDGLRAIG